MEDVSKFFQGFGQMPFGEIESTLSPQATIVKQNAPSVEKVTRNGIQKDVYVVIKNSPFVVTLGTTTGTINFNHVAFDCSLHYDVEGEKAVDFIKDKPLQFKTIPTDRGDQVNLELRLKVLTSQHEDMFFLVNIQGFDPHTKEAIPELKIFTHPIKVISKPEQLKKREPTKRRTVNETIIDIITNIEKTQAAHSQVLTGIYSRVTGKDVELPTTLASATPPTTQPNNKRKAPTPAPTPTLATVKSEGDPFENSFTGLLREYAALPPDQKGPKVRKMVSSLKADEHEQICQLIDLMNAEGLNRGTTYTSSHPLTGKPRELSISQDLPSHFTDIIGSDFTFF